MNEHSFDAVTSFFKEARVRGLWVYTRVDIQDNTTPHDVGTSVFR
jgi:hypothetical protein